MATLPSELRSKLERVVIPARDAAEAGARAALESLAVHHHEPYTHMKPAQRELRNHLRARAKQLGDVKDERGRYGSIDHLTGECAYEHWHRMLFARFLAENNLLIEPDENIAISLAEAEELAKDDGDCGGDVWVYASRCAQRMLPQIFRPDDPLLQITFATEHMLKLEKLLASLPAAVFTASDALGWVYQFWQSKKKDEVNRSEVKIGANEISAVTQLFTEPYMVEFLLHNTLGAWWAGKKLAAEDAASAKSEDELRRKLALPGVCWEYLRFVHSADDEGEGRASGEASAKPGWRPAAGTFDGWPATVAEIKVLDPCCGSGHFLVAALHHLVPMRMTEEGLSLPQAVDAVLRDNLHGLEIDERCCQIAAFALAFEAWKMTGYRELPQLHIACTGIGPQSTAEEWVKLAEQSGIPISAMEREPIRRGLIHMHELFSQAPTLGSLINPSDLPAEGFAADFETIQPYLAAILKAEKADDETRERAIAAAGMVKAADLLAGDYTLVITNVPYLSRGKQSELLAGHCEKQFPLSKADLSTVVFQRMLLMTCRTGLVAAVMPQNWLYQPAYRGLRRTILKDNLPLLISSLGTNAFGAISGWVVNILLGVFHGHPQPCSNFVSLDVANYGTPEAKAIGLTRHDILQQSTGHVLDATTDHRITLSMVAPGSLLADHADGVHGFGSKDSPCFFRNFWEINGLGHAWSFLQTTVSESTPWDGCTQVVLWEGGQGLLADRGRRGEAIPAGKMAWGRQGVAVSQMGPLPVALYSGEIFDKNVAVITPSNSENLAAIWAYCSSDEFPRAVRRIDRALKVTNRTLVKVPFDLAHWQKVAAKKYPDGLPEPESDNPAQWLFHGHPYEAEEDMILQVAVARLLGYRWPAELDGTMHLSKRARTLIKECEPLLKFADEDGIVCIPSVRGEEPAAERLFALLTSCDLEPELDLDDWLRNDFFEEHCKLFHDRPFIWHIWDGRKHDGFHALVNYHKLCAPGTPEKGGGHAGRRLLESLTYAYLGEWITRQKDGVKRGEEGAEDRLAAAVELQKRLEAILAGEPPFDLFVRWKKLSEQPIGWEPDINDGVRMNIRPFLASDLPSGRRGAGVLRVRPGSSLHWRKDRGKEPERPKAEYPWFWGWDEKTEDFAGGKTFDGVRWNDCHYTNKVKQAARDAAKKGSR
jgi:hypothetical protein